MIASDGSDVSDEIKQSSAFILGAKFEEGVGAGVHVMNDQVQEVTLSSRLASSGTGFGKGCVAAGILFPDSCG